jgi:hypothetical protein
VTLAKALKLAQNLREQAHRCGDARGEDALALFLSEVQEAKVLERLNRPRR